MRSHRVLEATIGAPERRPGPRREAFRSVENDTPPDGAHLPSRILKNPFSPWLLKKVQMQGGARCEVRGVLSTYVAAPREHGGTHRRWVSADGPF